MPVNTQAEQPVAEASTNWGEHMTAHQRQHRAGPIAAAARPGATAAIAVCIVGIAAVIVPPAHAQDAVLQKAALDAVKIRTETLQALAAITETADRICNIVTDSGTATSLKASGEIKTQLDGMLSKIVKFDASAGGASDATHYQGVLREDLSKALKDNADCKLHVFLKLSDQMLAAPPAPPPQAEVKAPLAPAPAPEHPAQLPAVVTVSAAVPLAGAGPSAAGPARRDWRDVGAGVTVQSSQGRWTTGSRDQCTRKYYSWNVDGDRISFRDQSDQIDVEQILAKLSDGFMTATVSSFHRPGSQTEAIGTRWQYQFVNNDTIRVQNFKTGASFNLTRC